MPDVYCHSSNKSEQQSIPRHNFSACLCHAFDSPLHKCISQSSSRHRKSTIAHGRKLMEFTEAELYRIIRHRRSFGLKIRCIVLPVALSPLSHAWPNRRQEIGKHQQSVSCQRIQPSTYPSVRLSIPSVRLSVPSVPSARLSIPSCHLTPVPLLPSASSRRRLSVPSLSSVLSLPVPYVTYTGSYRHLPPIPLSPVSKQQ